MYTQFLLPNNTYVLDALCKSASVSGTDSLSTVRVLIWMDIRPVRNIQQYRTGARERTRANRDWWVESTYCCVWPCFCLGSLFSCFSNSVTGCDAWLNEGRDSVVGVATRYDLGGPGIESRWGGGGSSAPVQNGPGAHSASYTMGTGSLSRG